MKQNTSKLLYGYWNKVRNGRTAPHRFEIQPAEIPTLLPETFIAECAGILNYRIRLAGTRICEQFGRELRGVDLLELWEAEDREGITNVLHNVVTDGAVGVIHFSAITDDQRHTTFEMVLMPLIHTGASINRIMGCITVIEAPFWLGTVPLNAVELRTVDLIWPDGSPRVLQDAPPPQPPLAIANQNSHIAGDGKRQFRVYEGGLSGQSS